MADDKRVRLWLIGRKGQGAIEVARKVRQECELWSEPGVAREMSYAYRVHGIPAPPELQAAFRAPHHSVSELALRGALDGHRWRVGEIALAHGGVLYLEDATEFSVAAIDYVAKAMSWGWIRLSSQPQRQVQQTCSEWNNIIVPTRFSLVVHTLPCPCGNRGAPNAPCPCTDRDIEQFHASVRPLTDGAEVIRV